MKGLSLLIILEFISIISTKAKYRTSELYGQKCFHINSKDKEEFINEFKDSHLMQIDL